jgi:predicted AlkP superfamily pyrophosphatase or phosphodiesterase
VPPTDGHPTVVLDVVGLTPALLQHAPNLRHAIGEGVRPLETIVPAVTCSVQSTFTTGRMPRDHGCVGNGWYFRDLAEVALWKQSNALVAGDKIWDEARRRSSSFSVAKLFWWFNMHASVDLAVTPRPIYPADGRKIPDIRTEPVGVRDELIQRFGAFPLFDFWGPKAGIRSTRWIARAAEHIFHSRRPTLTLVYLPHLDYALQRHGPDDERSTAAVRELDESCGELLASIARSGARLVVLSEYGITAVTGVVHVNRVLRRAGLLAVREELGTEKLDPGSSEAFAVADHQIAHVYVRHADRIDEVRRLLATTDGVETVLDEHGKREHGLDHPRSGELVAISRADRWFSYYYWLDDDRAPDFARTVDIHRKPGYDPAELFLDPKLRAPKLRIAGRLLQKVLGFRTLMDVIPLDASLVRGSHGRLTDEPEAGPLIGSSVPELLPERVHATDVREILLSHLFR